MSTKVIFLDIDGVLVTARILKERIGRQRCADDACVSALNRLTKATGAVLVISSSWRFCGLNEMRQILRFWQVQAQAIDITPDLTLVPTPERELYQAVPRGLEIQAWLDANPEVKQFVIIDDDPDMEHLAPYLVRTEFQCGLTDADVNRAVEILTAAEAQ